MRKWHALTTASTRAFVIAVGPLARWEQLFVCVIPDSKVQIVEYLNARATALTEAAVS